MGPYHLKETLPVLSFMKSYSAWFVIDNLDYLTTTSYYKRYLPYTHLAVSVQGYFEINVVIHYPV